MTANDKVYSKEWNKWSGGGACCAGSVDVESSHCLSNPILDGEVWMLNKNDDDDASFSNVLTFTL